MINRRGAIAAGIGAALGAKHIPQAMDSNATVTTPLGYYDRGEAATEKEWTLKQVAKMKRMAAGDLRDEDCNYPSEGPPPAYRALRSVSDEARHFMINRRCEQQWRERTIKMAMDALDHYDKTGILSTFF